MGQTKNDLEEECGEREREQEEMGWQLWRAATITSVKNRDRWKAFLNGLKCSPGHKEHK